VLFRSDEEVVKVGSPSPPPEPPPAEEQPLEQPVDDGDTYSKYESIPETKPEVEDVKPKKELSTTQRFTKGLQESTSGQAAKILNEKSKRPEELEDDPGFWETLVQTSGTLLGDLPYLAAGTTLGTAAGAALGSAFPGLGTAIGGATGGVVGAFAFNEFLKESLKQYHDFQDKGGDLTFGDFLSRAGTVGSSTLRAGAMGLALGAVQKAMPLLKATPIGKLFETKYVGKAVEKATKIGLEAGTAATVPAVSEGRLPSAQDLAVASVMFAAPYAAEAVPGRVQRLANYLPSQMQNLINKTQYEPINLAVAEKIEQQNLPYPALNELKGDIEGLKKNSVDLSNNLAQFDGAYMEQLAGKIDGLSPEDFPSTREAGLAMRKILLGETPDTKPVTKAPEIEVTLPEKPTKGKIQEPPEIPKPVKVDRPLTPQENPIHQALGEISPEGFRSDVEGGRIIQEVFHRIRDENKEFLDERYQNMQRATTGINGVDARLANSVEAFIEEHSQSAAPNTPEARVLEAARQVLRLVAEVGEEGEVLGPREFSVNELIKTNQSLKKIPSWNLPGEFTRVLTGLIETVNEGIVGHIRNENPNLAGEFVELNQDYRIFKNQFDNSATKVMFDPTFKEQAIHSKFSKIDGFNQISEALNTDPQGRQVANRLRRDVWQEKLGEGPLAARTESEFVQALSRMNERDFSNLMEYLTPEQRVAVNRRIQDVNRMRDAVNQYEQDYAQSQKVYNEAVAAQARDKANQRREIGQSYEQKMREHKKEVDRLKKEEQKRKSDYEQAKVNSKNKSLEALRNEVTEKQDLLVSITEQNPAKIVDNLKTEEGIIRTKKLCKDIPGGPEVFKAAAKFETENMFSFVRDSLIDSKRVPYGKIKKAMTNKDFRAKLRALNGEEFVRSMDELVSVADSLSDVYKTKQIEYINDPSAYEAFINGATALGIAHGELSIPLMLQVGKRVGLRRAANWWKKDNYTQEGIGNAVKAAKALRKGSKQEMQAAVKKITSNP